MKKVLVVGSLNMDQIIKVKNLPKIGETIYGDSLTYSCGGKGANQAVAISKMGVHVSMMGKVGKDNYGELLIKSLQNYKVNVDNVIMSNKPTGLASIYVDQSGNNNIVVINGANHDYLIEEIQEKENFISDFDLIVCQLEIPISIVKQVFKIAKKHNIITILNPAPSFQLDREILSLSDFIIPNETEFQNIFNIKKDIEKITKNEILSLNDLILGDTKLLITHGSKGVYLLEKDCFKHFNAIKVNAIDTTAAGDSFIGGFVYEYLNSFKIENAIKFGIKVASITVTRNGAQDSIPFIWEIKNC